MWSRIGSCFNWLGTNKDAITATLAIVLVVVGGYQYFVSLRDGKIEKALEILERREEATFIDARTTLIHKWIEHDDLNDDFVRESTYSKELRDKMTTEILADEKYRLAVANMSAYYASVAACALDGICDVPVLCASLMGEVQSYLTVNQGYFTHLRLLIGKDAKSFFLSLPEFVKLCDSDIFMNVASRHDRSTGCRLGVLLRRQVGFSFGFKCEFEFSKYDQTVKEHAENLKCRLLNGETACEANSVSESEGERNYVGIRVSRSGYVQRW